MQGWRKICLVQTLCLFFIPKSESFQGSLLQRRIKRGLGASSLSTADPWFQASAAVHLLGLLRVTVGGVACARKVVFPHRLRALPRTIIFVCSHPDFAFTKPSHHDNVQARPRVLPPVIAKTIDDVTHGRSTAHLCSVPNPPFLPCFCALCFDLKKGGDETQGLLVLCFSGVEQDEGRVKDEMMKAFLCAREKMDVVGIQRNQVFCV